ncbi:phage/plasmid primase, P4 family [Microbacterium sp. cf332]|uniref:DNA primase family protein n=1 Tax=Microbacterium sp. cf332 TaxID=1761804 RepID=UPI0008826839|nr:DNA primase family protein [Microbacterium sp. cf332]SDQ10948.1 phage/plasmid primase, P4 family, C-terminal domain-containing protein [Microbacterium sp. cf332]
MAAPSNKGDYFTDAGKFKPHTMAVMLGDNIAIGPDGGFWVFLTSRGTDTSKIDPAQIDPRVGVWVPDDEIIDRRVSRILKNEYTMSRASTVERLVRHSKLTVRLPATEPEAWAPLINLRNTMIDWRAVNGHGEGIGVVEVPHDPRDLSMTQLPIDYDPDATCPRFDAWMNEVLPPEVQSLVWESLGYMLMTGNPLQRAFLLLGPEGTGKSTFLRVLERLLGRENISAESLKSLTENRFSAANLFGKTANIVGDIDASYMNDTSLFLQITGGDTMSAEFKGKTAFPFSPYAVPVFSTNKVWQSANTSGAYFRRWVILPFDRKVDRSKPFDESALFAESPGIFNKAMRALRALYYRTEPVQQRDGSVVERPFREFEVIGAAREARERFARDSDPIREWLDEDEAVTADVGNERLRATRTTIYTRYSLWCEHNGIRRPKTGPEFYKALRTLGFGEVKTNGTRGFSGIYVYVPGEVRA